MRLEKLVLQNFRNHRKKTLEFSENTTAIIGPNAAGKSNILEAIYLLSIGKAVRAEKDEELVHFETDNTHVEGLFTNDRALSLALNIAKGDTGRTQKAFLVNGVKRRRMDFVGQVKSVLFTPEDIELIIDSPSIRREYINTVLSQVSSEYRLRLSRYEHALKRRNKVLYFIREGKARSASSGLTRGTDLVIWDGLLVESGEKLIVSRTAFFKKLMELNTEFPNISWKYSPRPISQEKLDENRARDIDAAQTLSGPHRDDFEFYDGKRNLHTYGSRGEQRIGILALKLAELNFIEAQAGQRPILLLDDIFSELDEEHRETVMKLIGQQQTILTSTEEDYVGKKKTTHKIVLEGYTKNYD